jgi:hypothetical protein
LSEEKPPLAAAIRHLAEQQRRSLTEHSSPTELSAYHAGDLSPEADARVREHLALCRQCSDLLLDLAGFADLAPPPGVPELTEAEVDEDWQALRARMGEKEQKPATVVPFPPVPRPQPARTLWNSPGLSIAATLLAVVGFSYGLYQWSEVRRLHNPGFVQEYPLTAETDRRRGPSEEELKTISSREGGLLYLTPDSDEIHPAYEAEILLDGKTIMQLPAKPVNPVAIGIPGGGLKPGEYRIRLYGIAQGTRVPVGEFPFRVDDP